MTLHMGNLTLAYTKEKPVMKRLLRKIFDEIIIYERDYIEMDAKINKEIDKHVTEYIKNMDSEEMEELKNLLYEITKISEREGFFLGLKYAIKLFLSQIYP